MWRIVGDRRETGLRVAAAADRSAGACAPRACPGAPIPSAGEPPRPRSSSHPSWRSSRRRAGGGPLRLVRQERGLGEVGAIILLTRIGAGALPFLYVGLGFTSRPRRRAWLRGGGCRTYPDRSVCIVPPRRLRCASLGVVTAIAVVGTEERVVERRSWLAVYVIGAGAIEAHPPVGARGGGLRRPARRSASSRSARAPPSSAGSSARSSRDRWPGSSAPSACSWWMGDPGHRRGASRGAHGRDRAGPGASTPTGRSAAACGRLRVRPPSTLLRLVAIAYVALSILTFAVTYPFLLAAIRDVPCRGRPGDRASDCCRRP